MGQPVTSPWCNRHRRWGLGSTPSDFVPCPEEAQCCGKEQNAGRFGNGNRDSCEQPILLAVYTVRNVKYIWVSAVATIAKDQAPKTAGRLAGPGVDRDRSFEGTRQRVKRIDLAL